MRSRLNKAMFDETRNTRLTSARLRDKFQNLLCKFVKIASIYATKSFQFLKQFG